MVNTFSSCLLTAQGFPRGHNTNVTSAQSQSTHEEQGSNHFGIPHGHGSNGAISGSTTYHHGREDIGFAGQDNNIAVLNRRRGNVNHQDGSIPTRPIESTHLNDGEFHDNDIDPNLQDANWASATVQSKRNSGYANGGMYGQTQDFRSSSAASEVANSPGSSPPRMSSAIGFGPRQYGNDRGYEDVPSFRRPGRSSMQYFGNAHIGGGSSHEGSVDMRHQTFRPSNFSPGFDNGHGYTAQKGQGMAEGNDMTASGGASHASRDMRFQSKASDRHDLHRSRFGRSSTLADGNIYGETDFDQQFGDDSEDGAGSADAGTMDGVMSNTLPANSQSHSGSGFNNGPSPVPASQNKKTRSKPKQKVGKPATKKRRGAMDPDNILIVDFYDNHNMEFEEIAEYLNNQYKESGKPPVFTTNSVHNRYNRSAPVIYKADGRVFVPIAERKRHTQEELDNMSNGINTTQWTPQMDQLLNSLEATYQRNKWQFVADKFNETTGENLTALAISTRFGMLRH